MLAEQHAQQRNTRSTIGKESTHRWCHRPILTPTSHSAVYKLGVAAKDDVWAEAELFGDPWAKALHKTISSLAQAEDELNTCSTTAPPVLHTQP